MKLNAFIFCIVYTLTIPLNSVSPFGLNDLLTGSKDVVVGVVKNTGTFLPTPTELFSGGKNLLFGLPIEYVSTTVNSVCSTLMSSNSVTPRITPDIYSINFQLMTACTNYSIPLTTPIEILNIKDFDVNKKTVILVTGWRTTISTSETIVQLSKAYNCRGGVNFLAIDAAAYVDTLFSWSALNTEKIGEYLGESLVQLAEVIPLESIHLIGHSLGAHICGAAGRRFNELTNRFLPRITALDPARPCFNEGESLSGLMRGDADFIDVIHSNPGILGKRDPTGDLDFYPSGVLPLPKGCLTVVCAHERSWQYYIETVYPGNEYNFMAKRCTSLAKLNRGQCVGTAIPMGYAAPTNLKGNYILDIHGSSPYGLNGSKARDERNTYCGSCFK